MALLVTYVRYQHRKTRRETNVFSYLCHSREPLVILQLLCLRLVVQTMGDRERQELEIW